MARCKPGDRAIIIGGLAENIGKLVYVASLPIEPSPHTGLRRHPLIADEAAWWCESLSGLLFVLTTSLSQRTTKTWSVPSANILDRYLQPLPKLTEETETEVTADQPVTA